MRIAVHEACREANKGIFNHLEDVLLRLVDAIEAGSPEWTMEILTLPELQAKLDAASAAKAELIQATGAYLRIGTGCTKPAMLR